MIISKPETKKPQLAMLLIGLCWILAPEAARAGGLFFPDVGTKALGRGAAFVARADNPSAFYYNPAGLSKCKGAHLLGGANLVDFNSHFLRQGTGEWIPIQIEGFPGLDVGYGNPDLDYSAGADNAVEFWPVSQGTAVGVSAVELVATWGDAFDVEGLAMAVGMFAPSGYGSPSYPKDGPQRYAIREINSLIIFPGLGMSYAINRYFQIGAVFLSGIALVEKSQATRLSPVPNDVDFNEDSGGDANVRLDIKDTFMPSGIIGVLSNPLDWLEIGLAVKLPVMMEAYGKVDFTAPETDFPNARLIEGRDLVKVTQHFPWMVSAGARYIHRYFDIELDFVWEQWSSYDTMNADLEATIDLEPDPDGGVPVNYKEMPDTAIPKYFVDTYSVRLGSDVEVWPEHIAIRAGGFYQSSAYPRGDTTFSLDFPYGDQFGLGGGLTWHVFKFLSVNVGYLHIFQPDVKVTEGILQQSGSPVDLGDQIDPVFIGNSVNNGIYKVNINVFSISLEGHFVR